MNSNILTNIINQHGDTITTWGIAFLLLLIALFFIWPAAKGWYLDLTLRQKINGLAAESLHQVVIPDGMDGVVYIENLLLTPAGLLILPVHRYQGVLFAADNIDNWTQVIGKRSYKFANPLPQLEADVLAAKNCVGDIPVQGQVLYTRGVEFPKGKPDQLISLSELESMRQQNGDKPVPAAYMQEWDELKQQLRSPDVVALREQYAIESESHFTTQTAIGLVLLLVSGVWLAWRYFSS